MGKHSTKSPKVRQLIGWKFGGRIVDMISEGVGLIAREK